MTTKLKHRLKKRPSMGSVIAWLLAVALLVSYGSGKHPGSNQLFAYAGLFYPIILMANLAWVLFFFFFRRKLLIINLIVIFAGWNYLQRFCQFSTRTSDSSDTYKVVTYNLRNYQHLAPVINRDSLHQEILRFMLKSDADFFCLQEFASRNKSLYAPLIQFKEQLGAVHYYYESYFEPGSEQLGGMVIYSKWPVVGKAFYDAGSIRKYAISLDIQMGLDTLRLYNVHLASVKLKPDDLKLITQPDFPWDSLRQERYKNLFGKISRAFEERSHQTDKLAEAIKNSPYPVLVCGDFNDSPYSYTYTKMTQDLQDGFVEAAKGFGFTYAGGLPFLRIDYIFGSENLYFTEHAVEKLEYSDHYPLVANFEINHESQVTF